MSRHQLITCPPDSDYSAFWDAVDKLRRERGVSLGELARRCNVSRSCLMKRRERKSGAERLSECAELFAALGWEMSLYIYRPKP